MKTLPAGCGYQGYEFGASYPDSICYGGRLYDADSCDGNGNLRIPDEDIPCPICRPEDAIKWHAGRSNGTRAQCLMAATSLVADIRRNRGRNSADVGVKL